MFGNNRFMWLRVVLWGVIIVMITFMLRKPEVGDEVGRAALDAMGMAPAPEWTELVRPAGVPDADQAGDASAVFGVVAGLDAACVPPGTTLKLTVGPKGLEAAAVKGYATECAAKTVWGAGWPAISAPVELELSR